MLFSAIIIIIIILVAILQGPCCYRDSARAGWPSVHTLWLGEIAS